MLVKGQNLEDHLYLYTKGRIMSYTRTIASVERSESKLKRKSQGEWLFQEKEIF